MRILKANIYFVLPDDFDGDINEAIELWALHKDQSQKVLPPVLSTEFSALGILKNYEVGYKTAFEAGIWRETEDGWTARYEEINHASRHGNIFFK